MQQEIYKGMAFIFDEDNKRATHVETGLSITFVDEDARYGVSEMYFGLKWRGVEQSFTAGYESGLHKIAERFPDISREEERKIKKEMSEMTLHLTLNDEVQGVMDSRHQEGQQGRGSARGACSHGFEPRDTQRYAP